MTKLHEAAKALFQAAKPHEDWDALTIPQMVEWEEKAGEQALQEHAEEDLGVADEATTEKHCGGDTGVQSCEGDCPNGAEVKDPCGEKCSKDIDCGNDGEGNCHYSETDADTSEEKLHASGSSDDGADTSVTGDAGDTEETSAESADSVSADETK